MTSTADILEMKARIVVFGVGGAGGNAINNMIAAGLEGVEFIVANTDAQALAMSKATRIIQMGSHVTAGLGCGAQPERIRQQPALDGGHVVHQRQEVADADHERPHWGLGHDRGGLRA